MPQRSKKREWWSKPFDGAKKLLCAQCARKLHEGNCSKRQWIMGTEEPPRGRCNDCIKKDPRWVSPKEQEGTLSNDIEGDPRWVAASDTGGDQDVQQTPSAWLDHGAVQKSLAAAEERWCDTTAQLIPVACAAP